MGVAGGVGLAGRPEAEGLGLKERSATRALEMRCPRQGCCRGQAVVAVWPVSLGGAHWLGWRAHRSVAHLFCLGKCGRMVGAAALHCCWRSEARWVLLACRGRRLFVWGRIFSRLRAVYFVYTRTTSPGFAPGFYTGIPTRHGLIRLQDAVGYYSRSRRARPRGGPGSSPAGCVFPRVFESTIPSW
jgi:hypothetical protein